MGKKYDAGMNLGSPTDPSLFSTVGAFSLFVSKDSLSIPGLSSFLLNIEDNENEVDAMINNWNDNNTEINLSHLDLRILFFSYRRYLHNQHINPLKTSSKFQ